MFPFQTSCTLSSQIPPFPTWSTRCGCLCSLSFKTTSKATFTTCIKDELLSNSSILFVCASTIASLSLTWIFYSNVEEKRKGLLMQTTRKLLKKSTFTSNWTSLSSSNMMIESKSITIPTIIPSHASPSPKYTSQTHFISSMQRTVNTNQKQTLWCGNHSSRPHKTNGKWTWMRQQLPKNPKCKQRTWRRWQKRNKISPWIDRGLMNQWRKRSAEEIIDS